jgi:hypothetical protein
MKMILLKKQCLLLLLCMHIVSLAMDLTANEKERKIYLKLAEAQQAYEKQRNSGQKTSSIVSQSIPHVVVKQDRPFGRGSSGDQAKL